MAIPRRKDSRFRFLTVTNSHDLERYNTQAVIDAFCQAFTGCDDVVLVVKDYGATSGDATIRRALTQAQAGGRVEYITAFTDKHELIRLYKSCDAFVSAHRGEGFGMKILDAMACGLPVVTPLFGGPTAYCDARNCFAVDFSLVPMGDCLDTRALHITNQPMWAEVDAQSLMREMRRVYDDRDTRAAIGALARTSVIERFSWDSAASRLVDVAQGLRADRARPASPKARAADVDRSPYWLGLRVSVVVPTHNPKEKLPTSLGALERQSILPQESEVIAVDDGSTDGTKEAPDACAFPFALRYFRQENAGPGTARNLGIQQAAGELVLFIGDDIVAGERLLEEHLLAHAAGSGPGLAVLGHIDWPDAMPRNAVMDYVCGDAALQFAYTLIPRLASLDHRFFYTSNISLKRQFLVDAASAGIRFDPCFRHAAFEDSEFAFRLMPRGLHPACRRRSRDSRPPDGSEASPGGSSGPARWRSSFIESIRPGRSAPGALDRDLVGPAALLAQPELLGHLEAFDTQTDAPLRRWPVRSSTCSRLIDSLIDGGRQPVVSNAALHTSCVVFDVQRTRGKLQEWFRTLATLRRLARLRRSRQ